MKNLSRLSVLLCFLASTIALHSQISDTATILSGKILFEPDSIYPLKPYSIIVEKSWPITFSEFEQVRIDTTDYSFSIRMDVEELTYGNIIINFYKDIDSTALERQGHWTGSEKPENYTTSDGFIREYVSRIRFSGIQFVIEPGDSVHMVINYNDVDSIRRPYVFFSGTGANNNNLRRSMYTIGFDSESFRLPLEEGLSREDDLMASKLDELQEAKDSISEAYLNLLKTDVLFDNLGSKHALIRAALYGSEKTVEEKRAIARHYYSFMDTLTLKPVYLNSTRFRGFLGFYLEYINRITTGRDVPYNGSETNSSLAKAIFEKEVLKVFLFEQLKLQMDALNFYKTSAFQYEDFIKQFPGTPEAYKLTQIHKKRFPVSNGQPAPDLTLIDSTGKSIHLSDLKGKVVLISKYYAGSQIAEHKLKEIEALRKKFEDNEIVLVALSSQFKVPGDAFHPSVDYYVKKGPNENLLSYEFRYQSAYTFIVRKNGLIEDCVYNLEIPENTIEKLKSESYTAWTRLDVFAQKHSRGIIVSLFIILSLTLVFILWIRQKQRRQQLIKKQLNSELKAIRSQLNPHFLFNSLNSLQNFINKSDTKTANLHLSRFSQLMRWIIELSEKDSISLNEELDFNRTFIELEQLRYGFSYTFDIDDNIDLFNVEIPSMIIQPFIENAIVHAMADLGEAGQLNVFVKEAEKNKISVEIVDNGLGFDVGTDKGFGLRSSRERIDLINAQYKEGIELQIRSPADTKTGKGTAVILLIPKKY